MRESRERHLMYFGLCLALIPVLLLRDYTSSNELRYLSVADEALRNHVFFAFTNHGMPFTSKPPLYLWIVMFCRWLTGGHHMWLLGLFSLLPAIGIARIIDRWTVNDMDGWGRSMARLILLTCGIFFVSAVTIRMDMLMSLFIVLALYNFWLMQYDETATTKSKWLFPIYIFLAVLTKGALGFVLPFCVTVTYLAVSGNIHRFFRYWGWRTWLVLVVCFAAWFAGVYAEGGTHYLKNLIVTQTLDRTFDSVRHAGPIYYYAVSIWYSLVPWSLLIIGIIAAALRPKFVRSPIQTFFLTASVTIFVVLSLVSSKLQIYLLPAVPFMVYAAAMFLPRFHVSNKWIRLAVAIPAGLLVLSLPALIFSASTFSGVSYLNNGLLYASATVLSLCGGNALYHLYNKVEPEPFIATVRRIGWGIGLAVFVASWSLPAINSSIGYGELCEEVEELSQEHKTTDFRAWHVNYAANMDAYLNHPVKPIYSEHSPTANKGERYLLMIPSKYTAEFPNKEIHQVGPYSVVVCQ